ncbi:MAG TPA: ABC transporter permease [Candidatus Saccharimonadales bacterium]|nr:ABC transporter permease [Candidatus Saccharimonadales bacterium]
MIRLVARRVLHTLPVLWAAVTLVWIFLYLVPGDPALTIAGAKPRPDVVQKIRQDLGLDRPAPEQYGLYLWRLLRGDLGTSYLQNRPVGTILSEGIGPSFLLGASAMLLALPVGVALGVAAARRGGLSRALLAALSLAGISMPTFWIGFLLIIFFSVRLGILPVSGAGGLSHLVLPAVTLAVYPASLIARVTHAAFEEQMRARHVTAARARGLAPRSVVWRHAFRTAMGPVVTISGLLTATFLGGAIATETVFAWPGLGQILYRAILGQDVMVVEGGVILLTGIFIAANLVVDLAYSAVDPRVRPQSS